MGGGVLAGRWVRVHPGRWYSMEEGTKLRFSPRVWLEKSSCVVEGTFVIASRTTATIRVTRVVKEDERHKFKVGEEVERNQVEFAMFQS